MDVFEAIYTRRSIRKFLDTPVEFDKLIEVIRAGMYAPCAGNLQNWKFVVETNTARIREMYHHTLEQEAFNTATVAVLVIADIDVAEKYYGMRGKRLYAIQNCAAAVQNMLLSAHAVGLGTVWIGAFDENRINDMYKIPSTARAQAIVLLGYPDEKPDPRQMKNPWYMINFHRYGLKYEHPHLITHDLAEEWPRHGETIKRLTRHTIRQFRGTDEAPAADVAKGTKEVVQKTGEKTKEKLQRLLDSLKKRPKK
jgi:nitroreductase